MNVAVLLFLVIIVFGVIFPIRSALRKRRRQILMKKPFPTGWEEILKANVPLYNRLSADLQKQLQGLIQIFLDEKNFEGCGGLEITEEIKVTIAAQACILLLNRKTTYYPKLESILVYPHPYVAKQKVQYGLGGFVEQESARLGESWHQGIVVLAWDNVLRGAKDLHDGHNVVLHEFAHQLDQEDGTSNGTPILDQQSSYIAWARHFSDEYQQLQTAVKKHLPTLIDKYGATNPAEFFAVVTETFFEKPKQMRKKHPELFEDLKEFYKVDPEEWA